MKRAGVWNLVLLIVIAVFLGTFPVFAANKVGDKAPGFSATTLDDKTVALSDYLGKKPVHLVFWATWCPNCLKEIPEINALQARFGDRLAILAINVGINDSVDAAHEYQKKHNMQYPVVFDDGNTISSSYTIVGTPTQILVGADGVIRYRGVKTPTILDIEKYWKELSGNEK